MSPSPTTPTSPRAMVRSPSVGEDGDYTTAAASNGDFGGFRSSFRSSSVPINIQHEGKQRGGGARRSQQQQQLDSGGFLLSSYVSNSLSSTSSFSSLLRGLEDVREEEEEATPGSAAVEEEFEPMVEVEDGEEAVPEEFMNGEQPCVIVAAEEARLLEVSPFPSISNHSLKLLTKITFGTHTVRAKFRFFTVFSRIRGLSL